ncbi:alpha/beta fold hydrolase [Ensifer sp. BR816]|uniref:alpha/beta fold hydrolase n=1 Tax=Rhizobium sp. (strain BR816) TaxID=1057002 RepID=UPI00035C4A99|nr:alpha/beta fold hydrolase [Ensifer sp. BR816]
MRVLSGHHSWLGVTALAATLLYVGFTSGAAAQSMLRQSHCATEALMTLGATCYEFTGEENWDHPNGKTVTLPVAVLSNGDSDPQLTPVFFFFGGPGATHLANEEKIQATLEDIKPRRLVLVEPRGFMYARPALHCPGLNAINHYWRQFAPDVFDPVDLDTRIKQQSDYVQACYHKLKKDGVDVTKYTDYEIVRDYEEIREALGYESIDLYGVSTGAGTVLSFLKYHGAHVRSAVLGWPWINELRNRPAIDEFFTLKQVYADILATCVRESKECSQRFPGYMFEVDRVRAILDAKPYETTVSTETGGQRKVRIDGAAFLSQLYIYLPDNYHLLPKVLGAIKRDDYASLNEFFNLGAIDKVQPETPPWALGHLWAHMCGDMGKNRPTPEESIAMIKREPALMGFEPNLLCAWWGEDSDVPVNLNTPPVVGLPVLALHGQLDTCCGTRWSEILMKTMPNLQRVELQGQGHGADSPCRHRIISAFLSSPRAKVDDSCKNDEPLRNWLFE